MQGTVSLAEHAHGRSDRPTDRPVEKLVEYRTAHYAARSEAASYLTNTPAQVQFRFANPILCQLVSGHKVMRVNGSPAFGFGPGDAMFVPPGMTIDIDLGAASPETPIECDCIEIESGHVDDILARLNEGFSRSGRGLAASLTWNDFIRFAPDDARALQLPRLMALFRAPRDVFADLLIDTRIDETILTLFQHHARHVLTVSPETEDCGLSQAVRLIAGNLDRQVQTHELAAAARMSESTLHRHFRRQFGTTPAGFARQLRLREAKKALRDGREPIESLAFRLGFADASHFGRVFRQSTSETPAEYRRRRQGHGLALQDGAQVWDRVPHAPDMAPDVASDMAPDMPGPKSG